MTAVAMEDATGENYVTAADFVSVGLASSVVSYVVIFTLGYGLMYTLGY